jgi:hypothetical protein
VEASNKAYPDYLTPESYHPAGTYYTPDEMAIIRQKYDHLDFKSLQKDLDKADEHFFKFPSIPNLLSWGTQPFFSVVTVLLQWS